MSTLAIRLDPHAVDVTIDASALHFVLADGREISAPLEWFPRLRDATPEQRRHWRLIGGGVGMHWEAVDEDVSVESLLATSGPEGLDAARSACVFALNGSRATKLGSVTPSESSE